MPLLSSMHLKNQHLKCPDKFMCCWARFLVEGVWAIRRKWNSWRDLGTGSMGRDIPCTDTPRTFSFPLMPSQVHAKEFHVIPSYSFFPNIFCPFILFRKNMF